MPRKILAAIIVVFLVVMPHELGHFVSARITGVNVERLSIGFGPTIICQRPRVTEYCLSWIPIGGYVALMDQTTGGQYSQTELLRIVSEKRQYFSALVDRDGWISQRTPLVQFSIAACGAAVNFLITILLAPLLLRYAREEGLNLDDYQIIEREASGSFIGPIGLLKIAGRSGEKGIASVLSLTARFSIAIGVLQLWPIPFFDGKHLVDAFFVAAGDRQILMLMGMGVWVVILRLFYVVAKQKLLQVQGVLVLKQQQSNSRIQRFIERILNTPR